MALNPTQDIPEVILKQIKKFSCIRIFARVRSMYVTNFLKACVRYFYQIFIFSQNDWPLKTMKNVFYFI